MNFACIYVPDLLLQAVVRSQPRLRCQPLAIIDGTSATCRVVAVNERARRAGIALGMTKLQIAEFPSIEICCRSQAQEESVHAALLDLGGSFSPRLEDTARDTVLLDLTGLAPLFGSPEDMAHTLARRASELDLEAQVAVASNPDAALRAARGFQGITMIPRGEESERLGSLPIEVLGPAAETLETLKRWGVRTFRELVLLPTEPLSERLGQEGVRLQERACGTTRRPLIPAHVATSFEEAMELEYPVCEIEPLSFILGRLLNRLCARLSVRALATNELRLRLQLEGRGEASRNLHETILRLPVPMRDSKAFLKLLQLHLTAKRPQAPIVKVTLAAEPARPRVLQKGLFLPLSPEPEKLELTLARISHMVGKENVGTPEVLDTHRPDAFRINRFSCRSGREGNEPKDGHRSERRRTPAGKIRVAPPMALRVFRPPLEARVETRAGCPACISCAHGTGDVVSAAGPWRSSGSWWENDTWQHDEWDVAWSSPRNTGTVLYCIFRDLASGDWFVRGVYD